METKLEPDALYLLALFGPEAEGLRRAVHNNRDWLNKSTGERCVFEVAGDPRHSGDQFLKVLSEMGIMEEELLAWQGGSERYGDADTARMNLCFKIAERLDIHRSDLPCLVYCTERSGNRRSQFHLPRSWWDKPERADSLVRRMIEVLAEEVVERTLEYGAKRRAPLAVIEKRLRTLADGVSWAEAWELDPTGETLLEFFQERQSRSRITSKRLAERTGFDRSSIKKPLSKMVKMGLLHSDKRLGYRITGWGKQLKL